MQDFILWATNNGAYHTLLQCFGGDAALMSTVLVLCGVIVTGYFQIAYDAHKATQRANIDRRKVRALIYNLRWFVGVFVFCALAGYAWKFVEIWFPAQRVYAVILGALAIATWRFIFHARKTQFFDRILELHE